MDYSLSPLFRPLLRILGYTALFVGFLLGSVWAREIPNYQGYVTDLADMISPGGEQTLVSIIKGLERTDSTQIAVYSSPIHLELSS